MNRVKFENILKNDKKLIDNKIKDFFSNGNTKLDEAVFYAIDGGKRIRPILFLETIRILRDNIIPKDLDFAISLEMIHAYSLIHDDLPAMDNDDFRRNKPTVHKKFGEDIAVLAGDYLLNTAFENILFLSLEDKNISKAAYYLAKCSGKTGMIEGQYHDIFKDDSYDLAYVLKVYEKKTSELFKGALVGAAIYLGSSDDVVLSLEKFGKYLGLSFQLKDDLLEENVDNELNILNVLDKNEAELYFDKCNTLAKNAVKNIDKNDFYMNLIDYLSIRTI